MTTLETISKICEILLGLYVLASISIILEVQRRINRKMNELIFQIEQYRDEQDIQADYDRQKGFEKCSECKYKDADLCKTEPLHEEDENGNCIDFVPEEPMPKEKWRIVKPGWIIVPKCRTCKYLKSPIVPCERCRDNSEYVPQNAENVRKESENG